MHLLMEMLTEKSLVEFTNYFRELNWEIWKWAFKGFFFPFINVCSEEESAVINYQTPLRNVAEYSTSAVPVSARLRQAALLI